MQGAGWLTLEDLRWDASDRPSRGRLATQAASTYKLPSFSEMPEDFRVTLMEQATEDGVVYGSKAVGEPPLMLAFCVREALREAVAAFGPPGHCVDLGCPSTPEQVFWAVEAARRRQARRGPARPACGGVSTHADLGCTGCQRWPSCAASGSRACSSRWWPCAGTRRARPARRWWSASRGAGARSAAATSRRPRCARARELLDAREPETDTISLTERAPARYGVQCCGGEVTLLYEPLRPVPAVAIFGMGHVGLELARILARHDLELHLVDSRAAQVDPERLGGGHRGRAGPRAPPPRTGARARARRAARRQPRADHDPRPRRGRRAVRRRPAVRAPGLDRADRVVGEVARGSSSKLAAEGHGPETLARITTPIGLPEITGKDPATIAVAWPPTCCCAFERAEQQSGSSGAVS